MHLNGKSSLKAIRSHWVGPWFSAPFLSTSISRKKRTNHDFLHLCCLLCLLAREVVKNFIKKYSVNSFIHVNVRQSLVHYNCTNRCPYVHQHVCYCNTFKALFAMINPTTFFSKLHSYFILSSHCIRVGILCGPYSWQGNPR